MKRPLRSIGAALAGVVAGVVAISSVQLLNYHAFPPPAGLDPNSPEDLVKIMEAMPVLALWMVEVSYVVGALVTGAVVGLIQGQQFRRTALVVGCCFALLAVANAATVPQPLWLSVLSVMTFVPVIYAMSRWVGGRRSARVDATGP